MFAFLLGPKQLKWPNMLPENIGNENEGYEIVHLFIQKEECGVQIFQKRKKILLKCLDLTRRGVIMWRWKKIAS